MNNDKKVIHRCTGIHISGPNVKKTAMVILEQSDFDESLNIVRIYDKIGNLGSLFSDDRLATILEIESPQNQIVVDCPLGLPPCVACCRLACPGINECDDISVAYMLSLVEKYRGTGKKRMRNLNPQTHRIWDAMQLEKLDAGPIEPSYSSNMSPLVNRARILQKRLTAIDPGLVLKETSIPHVLDYLAKLLHLPVSTAKSFRKFAAGKEARRVFVDKLQNPHLLSSIASIETKEQICQSVEIFQALIAALIAQMISTGKCVEPASSFPLENGWIYLPVI